jgi:hypothetical protein
MVMMSAVRATAVEELSRIVTQHVNLACVR